MGARFDLRDWGHYHRGIVSVLDINSLFRKYGPAVYRRARFLLGNHADAEEATQEVFIRAINHAESFDAQGQVYGWLVRITTNYCLNLIRDNKRRQELIREHLPGSEEAFPGAPSMETLVLLHRLLADAEENCAQAAVYVFIDGMSHDEAATLLQVSRRTVGNLILRFMQKAEAQTVRVPAEN